MLPATAAARRFSAPSYAPFVIEADPASPEFAVRDVVLPEGVSQRPRRAPAATPCADSTASSSTSRRVSKDVARSTRFYEKAYRLMTSAKAKEAFDLDREKTSRPRATTA